jgi:dTDP-4-amino-4,6-dideoxygalactose transaminase
MSESKLLSQFKAIKAREEQNQVLIDKIKAQLAEIKEINVRAEHLQSKQNLDFDVALFQKTLSSYMTKKKLVDELNVSTNKIDDVKYYFSTFNYLPSSTARSYLAFTDTDKSIHQVLSSDWKKVGGYLWDSWIKCNRTIGDAPTK